MVSMVEDESQTSSAALVPTWRQRRFIANMVVLYPHEGPHSIFQRLLEVEDAVEPSEHALLMSAFESAMLVTGVMADWMRQEVRLRLNDRGTAATQMQGLSHLITEHGNRMDLVCPE